ncbi:unnamed protein product [Didymodactylos carnosus]|uniref:Uncharacterized protein n=1 Tax=Didymodactylos carnosus TaxID=1234261 RepID=A0A814RKZ9_9BILA|nr:unnamed protein product [Didymodactylos carnosus]CAF3897700.1 unnamed protein product [Didymodactylos carnosus]
MAINSWLLANHLGKQNVNWENSRLCEFKTEIARTLLKGSVALQRPPLIPIQKRQHSGSDTDENNRSKSNRKKRESTRTIPRISRYDVSSVTCNTNFPINQQLSTPTIAGTQNYTYYSFLYAIPAGSYNQGAISISLLSSAGTINIDDFSVISVATGVELLSNRGFETGSLAPNWLQCNVIPTSAGIQSSCDRTGSGTHCYRVPSSSFFPDTLVQGFLVVSGQQYNFSFWLETSNVQLTVMILYFNVI